MLDGCTYVGLRGSEESLRGDKSGLLVMLADFWWPLGLVLLADVAPTRLLLSLPLLVGCEVLPPAEEGLLLGRLLKTTIPHYSTKHHSTTAP